MLGRLRRKMSELSGRVRAHAELLEEVKSKDEVMWEGFVTARRNAFTAEFFTFVRFKLEVGQRCKLDPGLKAAKRPPVSKVQPNEEKLAFNLKPGFLKIAPLRRGARRRGRG